MKLIDPGRLLPEYLFNYIKRKVPFVTDVTVDLNSNLDGRKISLQFPDSHGGYYVIGMEDLFSQNDKEHSSLRNTITMLVSSVEIRRWSILKGHYKVPSN